MFATFRETLTSLQDLHYGKNIIQKTLGQSFWYWAKYLLLSTVLGFLITTALLSYFVPQTPKYLRQNLPDLQVSIDDGQVSTNVPEPAVYGDKNFVFILNTKGSPEELDNYDSGIIVLNDRIVIKEQNGQTRIQSLEKIDDFSLSKSSVLDWVEKNKSAILGIGLVILLLTTLFMVGTYSIFQTVSFFLWGILFWVVAKMLKKGISYTDSVKIVIYASILPFILSALSLFIPNPATFWINLIAFLFYAFAWTYKLPDRGVS